MRIEVLEGDITSLDVDAIVNAANELMLGGGGVDGAIHDAAGPRLLEACEAVPLVGPNVRCPTGEARITGGFELVARHVIHTVGPIWRGGQHGEPELLKKCYQSALTVASEHGLTSVAFPAISCGAFGFPLREACRIAVDVIRDHALKPGSIEVVYLVAYERDVLDELHRAVSS